MFGGWCLPRSSKPSVGRCEPSQVGSIPIHPRQFRTQDCPLVGAHPVSTPCLAAASDAKRDLRIWSGQARLFSTGRLAPINRLALLVGPDGPLAWPVRAV